MIRATMSDYETAIGKSLSKMSQFSPTAHVSERIHSDDHQLANSFALVQAIEAEIDVVEL
jgi:hypothetical protein